MPRRRYLDKAAPADATYNSIRPVYRNIQVKKKDTPQRREKEAVKARARAEQARVTLANPRQASIGPYREKTAIDKAGGRLYAAAEQRAKDAQDREAAGVVLNALFKPVMPSTYVDMYDAYNRGEVNNITDALAAPYVTGSWSQRNPGKALATDILAPAAIGKAGIIGRNIANRNLFSYRYLEPYGYDNAAKRGFNILKHIIIDNKLPEIEGATSQNPMYLGMRRITGDYRDEAFRKYLGIPERTPLYIKNSDGTFSYNLNYLARGNKSVVVPKSDYEPSGTGTAGDMLTGNGGNVYVEYNNADKIASVYDVWDINPFSRIPDINVEQPIRNTIDKVYRGLYPILYKVGTKRGKFGYNYLGGQQLNRWRNPIIADGINRGSRVINNVLNKFVSPIRKFDAAKLLGGKNFTLKQDIPYKSLTYEDVKDMPLDYINLGSFYRGEPNFVDFNRVGPNGLIIK